MNPSSILKIKLTLNCKGTFASLEPLYYQESGNFAYNSDRLRICNDKIRDYFIFPSKLLKLFTVFIKVILIDSSFSL